MSKSLPENKISLDSNNLEDIKIGSTEQHPQISEELNEFVYQLKEDVKYGVEAYENLTKQKQEIDAIKQEVDRLNDIVNDHKNNAIPIMALFFGIFTFISIDLQFTTTLFSENSFLSKWSEGWVILIFLATQILFFGLIWLMIFCICKRPNKS